MARTERKGMALRAIQMFEQGVSARHIAAALGYQERGIQKLLKRHGVKLRSRSPVRARPARTMDEVRDQRALRAYGVSYAQALTLNGGITTADRIGRAYRYRQQRKAAIKRGIPWEINFAEWCGIWNDSGKWEMRGIGRGRYCMARNGDIGPYKVGNVQIILTTENSSQALRAVRARGDVEVKGYSKACKNRLKPYEAYLHGRVLGHFATPEEARAAHLAALAEV